MDVTVQVNVNEEKAEPKYYQHEDIFVRFDVLKDGEPTKPNTVTVVVYDPDKEFLTREIPDIVDTEVSFMLAGEMVEKVGGYTFVFKVGIMGFGTYNHVVKIDVLEGI